MFQSGALAAKRSFTCDSICASGIDNTFLIFDSISYIIYIHSATSIIVSKIYKQCTVRDNTNGIEIYSTKSVSACQGNVKCICYTRT